MLEENKKSRRNFLKTLPVALAGSSMALSSCNNLENTNYFQKNLRELPKDEIEEILTGLGKKYSKKYEKKITVSSKEAMEDTVFGHALDLSRCIGCRQCVYECVKENNQSRNPQLHWIRVLQMQNDKGIDFKYADMDYNPELVPEEGYFYLPVSCQQCENPQCVKVCPANATWVEPDGIVVVDYDWCIGCRFCMAACPYGARHFNWGEPQVSMEEINPNTHYLGNRPRTKGVVEKCTFCIQRAREGKYPSCVEICPTGSRKFGNLLDPESEIRYILEHKRVLVLRGELNTQPRFFYYFGV